MDQTYGGWNAPVNPETGDFVFVPIPESRPMRSGLETPYALIQPALARFEADHSRVPHKFVRLPASLASQNMHLDPDFAHLTYGDSGTRRGKGLTKLDPGDLVVFYSGLQPVTECRHRLLYALIGLYRVAEWLHVKSVLAPNWSENAHTRCIDREASDVIVRATLGASGRLKHCIPIGEFRDRAYRVQETILADWGGLSCKDGYLQRSAVLPTLLDPPRFMRWFERQSPEFVTVNNP